MKYIEIKTTKDKKLLLSTFDTSWVDFRDITQAKVPFILEYDGEYLIRVTNLDKSNIVSLKDLINQIFK